MGPRVSQAQTNEDAAPNPQVRGERQHFQHPAAEVVCAEGHTGQVAGSVPEAGDTHRSHPAQEGLIPHRQVVGGVIPCTAPIPMSMPYYTSRSPSPQP